MPHYPNLGEDSLTGVSAGAGTGQKDDPAATLINFVRQLWLQNATSAGGASRRPTIAWPLGSIVTSLQ